VVQADGTSPQGRAYSTGQPVIIRNLRDITNVMLPAFYAEYGIVSTVDVIIKGKDGPSYGVLEVDSPVQHTYNMDDVAFLTGFANVLAEAVATATRNDKLHQMLLEKDKLLDERAALAEELQHRVRNNLQLVHGMLTGHLNMTTGEQEKASVYAIIRRVMTLAKVYEQLLGTGMGHTVELGDYIKALCDGIPELRPEPSSGRIDVMCNADPLLVDLDTATALGMVVAEVVANSFEHAFKTGSGTINVNLRAPAYGSPAMLTVSDNGRGFVEKPGTKRHGVGLVRRLLQQVKGTAEMRSENGTTWTFEFPVPRHAVNEHLTPSK
jgi:two-component sensor histidine kinase